MSGVITRKATALSDVHLWRVCLAALRAYTRPRPPVTAHRVARPRTWPRVTRISNAVPFGQSRNQRRLDLQPLLGTLGEAKGALYEGSNDQELVGLAMLRAAHSASSAPWSAISDQLSLSLSFVCQEL